MDRIDERLHQKRVNTSKVDIRKMRYDSHVRVRGLLARVALPPDVRKVFDLPEAIKEIWGYAPGTLTFKAFFRIR